MPLNGTQPLQLLVQVAGEPLTSGDNISKLSPLLKQVQMRIELYQSPFDKLRRYRRVFERREQAIDILLLRYDIAQRIANRGMVQGIEQAIDFGDTFLLSGHGLLKLRRRGAELGDNFVLISPEPLHIGCTVSRYPFDSLGYILHVRLQALAKT
ncbi:hypothetical protein D3C79_779170 [compost metagenome]